MIDGAAAPLVKGGKLDLLAVTADRSPAFPDTPTLAEAGLPGFRFASWHGVFAPGHAPAVVDALAAAIAEAARDEGLRRQFQEQGIALDTRAGAAFASFLDEQRESIETLARERGLRLAQ